MGNKLVIFDYSGTLSPDAVRFAEDDTLTKALERSGLAALGVATPETFWSGIVNPTWEEGSTTPVGYTELIVRRIKEILSPAVPDNRIRGSAGRFVDSYLAHSSVDVRWHPILKQLSEDSSVMTVIATDHYAEATGYIVRHLSQMGVAAILPGDAPGGVSFFIVANSADMGTHKADRVFWEALRGALELDALGGILIVDDFGFNEGAGDSYADRRKVENRKEGTLSLLEGVFGIPVSTVSFMWKRGGDPEEDETALGDLIAQASEQIGEYLSGR